MLSDLERMKTFYTSRNTKEWSPFQCYPFFLACKQKWILTKLLNHIDLPNSTLLDIGSGEGDFLLTMIGLGTNPSNITAIEYLEDRILKLQQRLPHVTSYHMDYLQYDTESQFDIITIMAVLTSIVDNNIRYNILTKALLQLKKNGYLILYDFFDDKEQFLSENYRSLSYKKVCEIAAECEISVLKKVYLKSKYAKGLCKIKLPWLIPIFESLKIFNDNYHFIIIKK